MALLFFAALAAGGKWPYAPVVVHPAGGNFRETVCERLESLFHMAKGVVRNHTNQRTNFDREIVERDHYTSERRFLIPDRGSLSLSDETPDGEMVTYRKKRPVGDIPIPAFLVKSDTDGVAAYKELRLDTSKFRIKEGDGYTTKEDGSIVFHVTGSDSTTLDPPLTSVHGRG